MAVKILISIVTNSNINDLRNKKLHPINLNTVKLLQFIFKL